MNCELGWPLYKIFITSWLHQTHDTPLWLGRQPRKPTEGQRRPTKAHSTQRRPMKANTGPQHRTEGQCRHTEPNDGKERPTQAHSSPRKANAGPRRPTAPNDGTRRPTKATKANPGLAASAQANVHRFFFFLYTLHNCLCLLTYVIIKFLGFNDVVDIVVINLIVSLVHCL